MSCLKVYLAMNVSAQLPGEKQKILLKPDKGDNPKRFYVFSEMKMI